MKKIKYSIPIIISLIVILFLFYFLTITSFIKTTLMIALIIALCGINYYLYIFEQRNTEKLYNVKITLFIAYIFILPSFILKLISYYFE